MRQFITLFIFCTLFMMPTLLCAQETFEAFVSSRNTNSVKLYNAEGRYLGDFVAPGSGGLSATQDVWFHPNGNLLVSGRDNSSIKQYDGETGAYLGDFTHGYTLDNPTKMSLGPDSLLYVSQWGDQQNKIVRFDLNGQFIDEFTNIGVPSGCDHSWDAQGHLYVSSYGNGQNGKVYRFDQEGKSLGFFADIGVMQGPVGQWFDERGHCFVVDYTLGRVLEFNASGKTLGYFINGLINVEGHAFDHEGYIYLCDWTTNQIRQFDPEGQPMGLFTANGNLQAPNAIYIRPLFQDMIQKRLIKKFQFKVQHDPDYNLFNIQITLPQKRHIRIAIANEHGNILSNVAYGVVPSGTHHYEWSPSRPGTYYCELLLDEQPPASLQLIVP